MDMAPVIMKFGAQAQKDQYLPDNLASKVRQTINPPRLLLKRIRRASTNTATNVRLSRRDPGLCNSALIPRI